MGSRLELEEEDVVTSLRPWDIVSVKRLRLDQKNREYPSPTTTRLTSV